MGTKTSIALTALFVGCTPAPKSNTTTSPAGAKAGESMCFDGQGRHCLEVVAGPPRSADYIYDGKYPAPRLWIDRHRVNESSKVATNFALKELYNASEEKRFVALNPAAVSALQRVRDDWFQKTGSGLRVNSGFRSPAHNRKVGGVVGSRHTYGDAFDIQPSTAMRWDQRTRVALRDICRRHGFNETKTYLKKSHIHCAMDPSERWRDGHVGFDAWIVRLEDGTWKAEWADFDGEGDPMVVWQAEGAQGAEFDPVESLTFKTPPKASRIMMTVADVAYCEADVTATGRIPCETNGKAAPPAQAPSAAAPASKAP